MQDRLAPTSPAEDSASQITCYQVNKTNRHLRHEWRRVVVPNNVNMCAARRRGPASTPCSLSASQMATRLMAVVLIASVALTGRHTRALEHNHNGLKYEPTTGVYSGLTFTFEPQLDKQVEQRLHLDHWRAIMEEMSQMLRNTLSANARLAELRVLIPFKWRHLASVWLLFQKPGSPIMANRRLRYAEADVLIGREDPIYKETPYAVQHDECGRPGLNIRVPMSFLARPARPADWDDEAAGAADLLLKGRRLAREFLAHRYGVFKESGFPADPMYPPYSSVAGLAGAAANQSARQSLLALDALANAAEQPDDEPYRLAGFDQHNRPCSFETLSSSGLPAPGSRAASCLPFMVEPVRPAAAPLLFNLMGADPFLSDLNHTAAAPANDTHGRQVRWRQLAQSALWRLCGDGTAELRPPLPAAKVASAPDHNKRASNKQNRMCQERSALEVIRASDDFRHPPPPSSSGLNEIGQHLAPPSFSFLQELPPRIILCIEYTSFLFQSRRLDHTMLEAAVNKLLAFDLIADSELATVVFGQHQARSLDSTNFQRLEASLSSRFTLFNPALDPFDEPVRLFTANELAQLGLHSHLSQPAGGVEGAPVAAPLAPKLVLGSCSFARLMGELNQLLHRSAQQYDDMGADLVLLTSGLFVENEAELEELVASSNFKHQYHRLHLLIYPSSMLFDTKSRDGYIVLDSQEGELIIRSRVNKLLLIQRLTGASIHLVREQLDSNGDVRMSTLVQFYQIFQRLTSDNSWHQTNSMLLLASQQVDSRQLLAAPGVNESPSSAAAAGQPQQQQHRLSFQFELDDSVQNELLVGFIEPKLSQHHHQRPASQSSAAGSGAPKPGKRFQLSQLQLRSPGGQLLFTETGTHWRPAHASTNANATGAAALDEPELGQLADLTPAFFPYRAQLSLAAFHIKASHLSQLQASRRLAGTWTLSAISEEPLQTSGLAMARTSPAGDTISARCWIQTYTKLRPGEQAPSDSLKQVKVFAQVEGGAPSELASVSGRMEVQDEMGNIVQNVQMLDDGLGTPDMTRHDAILTQLVQRAHRPGFYRVLVELAVPLERQQPRQPQQQEPSNGQDNICCGSSIPVDQQAMRRRAPRAANRQLYCGTFHVDPRNQLGQQRPPRVTNLTAVNVDQENRRVSLRWYEPALDISAYSQTPLDAGKSSGQLVAILSDNDLLAEESAARWSEQPARGKRVAASDHDGHDDSAEAISLNNVLVASHQRPLEPPAPAGKSSALLAAGRLGGALANRYEIKLFTDRDIIKNAFDAKHEIGFKFNEWNVEGQFPNASQYGGMKEVTLRVPFAREGLYFIAMKVYNNQGLASELSNIVQFYLRNNLTLEEAESIYNQPGAVVDAEGNVYDKNGELIHQRSSSATNQLLGSYSLLKGTGALDGLSVLVLVSLLAFITTITCVTLFACVANSVRESWRQKKKKEKNSSSSASSSSSILDNGPPGRRQDATLASHEQQQQQQQVKSTGSLVIGSGSSMVSQSSGCESSEAGSNSQLSNSYQQQRPHHHHHQQQQQLFHSDQLTLPINECHDTAHTTYSELQQQQKHQQHQAQLIQNQMISSYQQAEQDLYNSPAVSYEQMVGADWQAQQQQSHLLQHTVVNGYTYATVLPQVHQQQQQHQPITTADQQYQMFAGDLNQNGLGSGPPHANQHQHQNQAHNRLKLAGLAPQLGDKQLAPAYLSQQKQLQQQLSSVLKSKRQLQEAAYDIDPTKSSSPALEGVRGDLDAPLGSSALDQMAPPPPQYIYCRPAQLDTDGLGTIARDPSIYSHSTNLQQVPSTTMQDTSYYANHYDNPNLANWVGQPVGPPAVAQGGDNSAAISEV